MTFFKNLFSLQKNNFFFIAIILILYIVFVFITVNKLTGYSDTEKLCTGKDSDCYRIPITKINQNNVLDENTQLYEECMEEYDKCNNNKREKLDKIYSTKFFVLIIIGIITMLAGALLRNYDKVNTGPTGTAMAISSIIIILIAVLSNWYNMNEMMRILIIGLGLLVVILFSIYA